jgi:hypothetical protein
MNEKDPYQAPEGVLVQPPDELVAPCFHCGCQQAIKVKNTWWGGRLGPRLLRHVKCVRCGHGFDGKTGLSNQRRIWMYIGITVCPIVVFNIWYAIRFFND